MDDQKEIVMKDKEWLKDKVSSELQKLFNDSPAYHSEFQGANDRLRKAVDEMDGEKEAEFKIRLKTDVFSEELYLNHTVIGSIEVTGESDEHNRTFVFTDTMLLKLGIEIDWDLFEKVYV